VSWRVFPFFIEGRKEVLSSGLVVGGGWDDVLFLVGLVAALTVCLVADDTMFRARIV
jgi:hypothetical protein